MSMWYYSMSWVKESCVHVHVHVHVHAHVMLVAFPYTDFPEY